MKKLIVSAILALLWASPAFAQNTLCADKPPSDSSNACANTRFVQSHTTPPGGNNGDIQYNNNGAFGGISVVNVPRGGTGQTSFTAGLPLIGNGTSAIAQGTRSGNTTTFGTTTGTLTSGNCVQIDADGNLVDAGAPCSTASTGCPIGWFCVSQYANIAAAVSALNTAGGGTLYIDQDSSVSSALTISVSANVICAPNIILSTNSTTNDLLVIAGEASSVLGCHVSYSGTPGTKTAGALINLTAQRTRIDGVFISGGCFYCISINGIETNISNIRIEGNTTIAGPVAGSAIFAIGVGGGNEVTNIVNVNVLASVSGMQWDNIVLIEKGSVSITNMQGISANTVVKISPRTGATVFLELIGSWLDDCKQYCMYLDATSSTDGSIGNVNVSSTWMALASGGIDVIRAFGRSNGGFRMLSVTNSFIQSYVSNANHGVALFGGLATVMFNNNDMCALLAVCFYIDTGATVSDLSITGNSIHPTSYAVFNSASGALVNPLVANNRLNGSSFNWGGASTTYVVNNVP